MTTRTAPCPECGEDLTFEIGWEEQAGSGKRYTYAQFSSLGNCVCPLTDRQIANLEYQVADAYDQEGPDVD